MKLISRQRKRRPQASGQPAYCRNGETEAWREKSLAQSHTVSIAQPARVQSVTEGGWGTQDPVVKEGVATAQPEYSSRLSTQYLSGLLPPLDGPFGVHTGDHLSVFGSGMRLCKLHRYSTHTLLPSPEWSSQHRLDLVDAQDCWTRAERPAAHGTRICSFLFLAQNVPFSFFQGFSAHSLASLLRLPLIQSRELLRPLPPHNLLFHVCRRHCDFPVASKMPMMFSPEDLGLDSFLYMELTLLFSSYSA